MALHTERKCFQSDIQKEAVIRRRDGTKISHKLRGCFGDIGFFSKLLCVHNSVIRLVRLGKTVVFVTVGFPVKVSAVNDRTSYLKSVTIHIFCGGVGDDISAPFKGTAVDGGGKGIVNNKGNSVLVSNTGKFFDIQNYKGRVGNGFRKKSLGVRTESSRNFLRRCVCVHKGTVNAQFFEGNSKKIKGSAVDGGGSYHVISGLADIKNRIKVCSLSGRSEKRRNTAFQFCDFRSNSIVGRILKAGIEIALGFQVKKLAHFICSIVFKSGALINRKRTWFSLGRSVACMEAFGFKSVIAHVFQSFLRCKFCSQDSIAPL